MRRLITLIATLAVMTSVMAVPAFATERDNGVLNVVHGIPGVEVDVCASGDLTEGEYIELIDKFNFKDIEEGIQLPAGDYNAFVRAQTDAPCDESQVAFGLIAKGLTLPAGANVSVVANLDFGGTPELSVFVNNTDPQRRWASRITVRHTADAPTVDVYTGRYARWTWKTFDDVSNGDEGSRQFWAGRRYIGLALDNSKSRRDIAIGPIKTYLHPTANNVFYAVGSLDDGTFEIISQVIEVDQKRSRWWWF